MGIPLEEALSAATINPARSLGASVVKDYGSIEAGKKADLVLWNRELSLKTVIKNGKIVQNDPHKVRL
jgi:N-acetylglucosamine-6-phosphate deacetylase